MVRLTAEHVARFAELSGDYNPLHLDPAYAATTELGRPVVHGMVLAGFLSRLVGMHLPGRRALYASQSLEFAQPGFVGDEVEVSGQVERKHDATRVLVLRTEVRGLPSRILVRGKAYVRVLG